MPTRLGLAAMERRSILASRLRLIAVPFWPCLVVACTPFANVLQSTSAGATVATSGRSGHAAPAQPSTEVAPPVLMTPANHATVSAKGHMTKVKLSWHLAHRRSGQRNFVEVMARDDDGTHEVYAAYVTGSYIMVRLPSVSATYVWRVYAMEGGPHYAPSGWGGFSIASRSAQQ